MDKNGLSGGDSWQSVELIYGYDEAVSRFVAGELGAQSFGDCRAIGIALGNELVGGVVYNVYRGYCVEMSIATTTPKWCTRSVLRALFHYPFNVLGCKRITVLVDVDNEDVRRFDERLGFIYEGTLKEGHPSGDCAIYRMLRDECKWLR